MTITQFIEKAIEGGWLPRGQNHFAPTDEGIVTAFPHSDAPDQFVSKYEILLDPEAWKAVGKVEGWMDWNGYDSPYENEVCWYGRMHRMIDALCDGKTLEDSLASVV